MSVSDQPISSEPTMDEILASIRRMLKEEDEVSVAQDDGSSTDEPQIDLDPSMVEEPGAERREEAGQSETPEALAAATTPNSEVSASFGDAKVNVAPPSRPTNGVQYGSGSGRAPSAEQDRQPRRTNESSHEYSFNEGVEAAEPTVSDKTVRDAGRHLGSLVRSLSSQRTLAVSRGGTSLEDIVRDELRPLLKTWLDSNLPELVERLVRAEIERLIERTDH